ncbi:MAG: hypothetical protein ACYDC2_08765 [Solirubrobacteraceae bacterium]
MAEVWLPALLVVAVAAVAAVVMVRSGALMTAETASIRRVRQRLVPAAGWWAATVARTPIGRTLQDRFAIRRLQLAAGRGDPQAFVRRVVGVAALVVAACSVLDATTGLLGDGLVLAPIWIPVAAAAATALSFAGLQREAGRRREVASSQVAKTLLLFGLLRVPPVHSPDALRPGDPLLALAWTMRDHTLAEMLASDQWRQVVETQPRSRADLLEAVGSAYGLPVLAQLAAVVRSAQEYGGGDPAAEYLAAARSFTAQRLADARVRLGSRTITVLVPMVGLLAAIFVVIFSAVAYASANGGL